MQTIKNYLKDEVYSKSVDKEKVLRKINFPHRSTANLSMKQLVSLFIILIIVMFEVFVCIRSFEYYFSQLSFPFIGAISCALLIEALFMSYSAKSGIKNTILKYIFFTISIYTLAYSNISTDKNLQRLTDSNQNKIVSVEKEIAFINNQLNAYKDELIQIGEQMSVYMKNELVTKGNRVLAPRKKEIEDYIEKLQNRLEIKNKTLDELNDSSKISILNNLDKLSIKTIMIILVFSIIQIAICFTLKDFISDLFPKKTTT